MDYEPVEIPDLQYKDILYFNWKDIFSDFRQNQIKNGFIQNDHAYLQEARKIQVRIFEISKNHSLKTKEQQNEALLEFEQLKNSLYLIPIPYTEKGKKDIIEKTSLFNFYQEIITTKSNYSFSSIKNDRVKSFLNKPTNVHKLVNEFYNSRNLTKLPAVLPRRTKSDFFNFLKDKLVNYLTLKFHTEQETGILISELYKNPDIHKFIVENSSDEFWDKLWHVRPSYPNMIQFFEELGFKIPESVTKAHEKEVEEFNYLIDTINGIINVYAPNMRDLIKKEAQRITFLSQAIEAAEKEYNACSPNQLALAFDMDTLPEQNTVTSITFFFNVDTEGKLPEGVSIGKKTKPYSSLDNRVIQAVTGLQLSYFIQTGKVPDLSCNDITKQVYFGTNPTGDMLKKVKQSLTDLQNMDISINCQDEMKQRLKEPPPSTTKNLDRYETKKFFRGRILDRYNGTPHGKMLTFVTYKRYNKTEEDNMYHFLGGLPLFAEYILATGQFTTLKDANFDIFKFSGTKQTKEKHRLTEDKSNLLQYILVWVSQKTDNNPTRLLKTIYNSVLGGTIKDTRRLIRLNEFLIDILKNCMRKDKTKDALIYGFEITCNNGAKYKLPLPAGNHTHQSAAFIPCSGDIRDITLIRHAPKESDE